MGVVELLLVDSGNSRDYIVVLMRLINTYTNHLLALADITHNDGTN